MAECTEDQRKREGIMEIKDILQKATPRPWDWAYFTHYSGRDIVTVEDVAETVAFSARKGTGTQLWGVTPPSDDGDKLVICHTGNGPTSEINAGMIVLAVNTYESDQELITKATSIFDEAIAHMEAGDDEFDGLGPIEVVETLRSQWRAAMTEPKAGTNG